MGLNEAVDARNPALDSVVESNIIWFLDLPATKFYEFIGHETNGLFTKSPSFPKLGREFLPESQENTPCGPALTVLHDNQCPSKKLMVSP